MVSGICWVLHMGTPALVPNFPVNVLQKADPSVLTEMPQAKLWDQNECEGVDGRCRGK